MAKYTYPAVFEKEQEGGYSNYIDEINNYTPKNEQEAQDKKVMLDCIKQFPSSILSRENETVHITSSGFILNHTADKALMVHHNLFNTWVWPGGHADGNGNLLEVAIKEVLEETGITVKPLSNKIASIDIFTPAGHVRRGSYVKSHTHLNVAYIFIADENEKLTVQPDENTAVGWIPIEQINEDSFASKDVYLYTKLLQQAKVWFQAKEGDYGNVI